LLKVLIASNQGTVKQELQSLKQFEELNNAAKKVNRTVADLQLEKQALDLTQRLDVLIRNRIETKANLLTTLKCCYAKALREAISITNSSPFLLIRSIRLFSSWLSDC